MYSFNTYKRLINKKYLLNNWVAKISFISVAINGWQLAKQVYSDESTKKRRKQQIKYFFRFLFNSQFASVWLSNLKKPCYTEVATDRKLLATKPFRRYISNKWTKKQKAKVILDNHRFISSKSEYFKNVITNREGIEIASFNLNETLEGHLNLNCEQSKEGELVLSFKCKQIDEVIVSATFSFEEKKEGLWVCWIGSIQGHRVNDKNISKMVQKQLHGFRPKSFIVFIVQEFVRNLGFRAIYGVNNNLHISRGKYTIHLPWNHGIKFDYNSLWIESGGKLTKDGWFELPILPNRRSYEEIQTEKRALYRRRYSLCDDISSKIAHTVKKLC
ncbi:VirK/YbjX family protein [Flavobacterium myungsuense]|uniref:VirK/YbjX family protein n=1 Tax=Flavobacterium myungsuense TaxID=651823 RepID=A0ABW3J4M5_9FLAO